LAAGAVMLMMTRKMRRRVMMMMVMTPDHLSGRLRTLGQLTMSGA
jgi:hypothetical protein